MFNRITDPQLIRSTLDAYMHRPGGIIYEGHRPIGASQDVPGAPVGLCLRRRKVAAMKPWDRISVNCLEMEITRGRCGERRGAFYHFNARSPLRLPQGILRHCGNDAFYTLCAD